jgi:hypothetical protein
LIYQLVLTFFGLTPAYKIALLEEIHSLCYFGQGGFTHDDVYDMPVRYRHYHLKKIAEYIDKQNEITNAQNQTMSNTKPPKDRPPIPDFATQVRAPKK